VSDASNTNAYNRNAGVTSSVRMGTAFVKHSCADSREWGCLCKGDLLLLLIRWPDEGTG